MSFLIIGISAENPTKGGATATQQQNKTATPNERTHGMTPLQIPLFINAVIFSSCYRSQCP